MSASRSMLNCMRTTLNLPDALIRAVKERARSEGETMTSFIEDALRSKLAHTPAVAAPDPLPTFGVAGTSGLLIDIDDKQAVEAALDRRDR